jgi:D-tyrosyl-tRNA(Tyr) deacylase
MRAVVQRVFEARVIVAGATVGAIGRGLLAYVGIGRDDRAVDLAYLADKLAGLRVFEDDQGRMGRSITDAGGSLLLVSQFTLYGDVRRGRRPSFDEAMPAESSAHVFEDLVAELRARGLSVQTGVFRAEMRVECAVDGPVTVLIDSRRQF